MIEQAGTADRRTGVLLVADDYAMTNGISRAILELADARRLSGTSAMTTTAHWPSHATWLARARDRLSAGVHLNLTLGRPLGPMRRLAPAGTLPGCGDLIARATRRALPLDEIAEEVDRQLAAFELEIGFPPDHVDGHQHVHALPGVRTAVLDVLTHRYGASARKPLLRDPAEPLGRIARRGRAQVKAFTLSTLARGFGTEARRLGFPVNEGFSGVTDFAERTVGLDLAAACRALGPRPLVMCHPGFVDDELKRIDPVLARREREFEALQGGMPAPIFLPQRSSAGDPIDWARGWTGLA